MQETLFIIILTAVVSSGLTLGLGYLIFAFRIKPNLDNKMAALGDEVEQRVRDGVLAAGEELLPKFRDKVTEGFTRALAEWPTSEMSRMARTGATLVEEGLNTILGKKR